ncbi:MAG TPA: ROK family protein [Candidatus Acidoferrales bacterium]|jgi:glucokinase|nr:ROK family protein [Candidatus Acidoferrales bacterium]
MSERIASEKHPMFIGVDLGGTNVRAGLVHKGKITSLHKRPISSHAEQKIILKEICETIAAALRPGVKGIGIGVPSLVKDGVVYSVANIPSWRKVPLKKLLEKHFGIPVYVNNDAKCFALGELHYGLGRGRKNLVGLIIGTGLGCGVVINGRLYTGSNGAAGELGHAPYMSEEIEHYCSGRFFKREFGLDSREIQDRADAGDFKAAEMLAAFGDHFANAVMTVLFAYDPEIIVLGGGVSRAYHYFEPRMREKLRTFRFQNALKRLKIVPTKKPHIAVLAAAALCLDKP